MAGRKKGMPVMPELQEEFIYSAPEVKAKPFWKRKRFLFPAATALLAAVGVGNPEATAQMGATIFAAIQGHSMP